ncbi:MAG: hypothetical protein JSS39_04035 [Nitrospira sp.]|nr:hypothetical protein [Nitrospira sp.]
MMRSHVCCRKVWLVELVTLIYSALLVMAAGCALDHADPSQNHQHHHSEERSSDHNLLCAWACQATTDAAEASEPPPAAAGLAVGPADFDSHRLCLLPLSSTLQARAPPSVPFIRLG